MYRRATLPEGACPRCYEPLAEMWAGDRRVHGCRSCGGAFLDNLMSQDVIRRFDAALVTFGTNMARGKAEAQDHADVRLSCPHCATPLQSIYVQSAACRIDACAEHGTWFDAGELLRVGRAYRQARTARGLGNAMPSGASATIPVTEEPKPRRLGSILLELREFLFSDS